MTSAKHGVAGQYYGELYRDHSAIECPRLPYYLKGCVISCDIYASLYRTLYILLNSQIGTYVEDCIDIMLLRDLSMYIDHLSPV